MADNTLSVVADLLYEMRGPMQENFPKEHVLLAELSGVGDRDNPGRFTQADDLNRQVFSGSGVRVPLQLSPMGSGGSLSETGTVNVPSAMQFDAATVGLANLVQPFGITLSVEEDSKSNSAAEALALLLREARVNLANIENDMMNNTGALLESVASNTGSAGLAVDVGVGADWDKLYPGRIVDILTRSNGADPGNGLRRRIASIDEAAGTVTFATAATASDGGSGNITFASTSGIYIPGSYGTAMAGLEDGAAITGTFENIDKAAVAGWQGTDGRGGVTTTVPLTTAVLNAAVRRGRRSGIYSWDFGLGHPAVIDLYAEGLYNQVRYSPNDQMLKSGFKGIVFDGPQKPIVLVKEPAHTRGRLKLVHKESLQLYGRSKGPDFDDKTGSINQRFGRTLPSEVWLVDRAQLGFKRCNTLVFVNNLDEAS